MEITRIQKLSTDLTTEAVQRTSKTTTKKGYDTTGYAYQYLVDRFNEVCGEDWSFGWEIIKEITGAYAKGTPFFDLTVKVWIAVGDKPARSCVGGHTAVNFADALKGAITNGFKKTAAFWGVGARAFRGTIDDDNQPLPDSDEEKIIERVFTDGKQDPLSPVSRAQKVVDSFDWSGKTVEYQAAKKKISEIRTDEHADVLITRVEGLNLPPKKTLDKAVEEGIF